MNHNSRRMTARITTDEEIASIHHGALTVLREVGILIHHERALSLLTEAGATVDPASHLVRIPAELVERALRTVPSQFLVCGHDASKDVPLGCDWPPRARPVISLDWIVDYRAKERRQVTTRDLESWVRVADALPNQSLVTGLYPWDVPLETRDIRAAEAMLRLSRKPILMAPYSGQSVRWIAQMLSTIGARRGPRVIVFCSCNSPLIFSESQMDVLLEAVGQDLPVLLNSSPVTGATAPITLAGTLVMMNAEILAGLTVAQLARPGAKMLYAGFPFVLDMMTSVASNGYTECGLLAAAIVEVGRSYHLPTASNGLTTDSHVCDEQAAVEKLLAGYAAVLSGASLSGGAGSLAAVGTASLEQLVIDDDIYERVFRFQEGMNINRDTLAVEVIAAVGPQHHFLEQPHTLEHLRGEFCHSKLATRLTPGAWMERGSPDALDVVADRVKNILKESPASPLAPQVLAELRSIVVQAEELSQEARQSGG